MAQYRFNGQVLVKNSRREDFKYACIENRDGRIIKIQISSTFDGAGAEKRRRISETRETVENNKRAIEAIKNGRDYYIRKCGKHSQRREIDWYQKSGWIIPDEQKAMKPIDFYQMRVQENLEAIEWYEKNWIIVEVEKV